MKILQAILSDVSCIMMQPSQTGPFSVVKQNSKAALFLAVFTLFVFAAMAPVQAQFYLKRDNNTAQDSNDAEQRSIFLAPKTNNSSKVYKPPAPTTNTYTPPSKTYSQGSQSGRLQKKDYSAKIAPSAPTSPRISATQEKPCTEKERRIYQSMQKMNDQYMQVINGGYSTTVNKDGSYSFTLGKDEQAFMNKYTKTYAQIDADPAKVKRVADIMNRCRP